MSLLKIDHIAEHTPGSGVILDSTLQVPTVIRTDLETVSVVADAEATRHDAGALILAGTQLGQRVVYRAHSFDTTDHKRDFIIRAKTTSNAGAGMIEIITRFDLGGLTTVFSVDDLGAVTFASLTVASGITITAGGMTITAGGLTVTAGGITVTAGDVNMVAGVLRRGGTQVVTARQVGWGAPTGTATRTTFATFAGQVITNPPTQAEVQAIDNHVKILSERLKALIDDLTTHGLIGA